jgi:uncharacterized protein YjeT (DUF2065 family)
MKMEWNMEWSDSLGLALALMLIFEGLMPLFAPQRWRRLFLQLLQLRDGQLRFCGLLCIAAGIILLILS